MWQCQEQSGVIAKDLMEHFTLSSLSFLKSVSFFFVLPFASGFLLTERDSYLANHVVKTLSTKDWMKCTLACQGDSMCVSYNYNTITGSCELHDHGIQTPFTGTDQVVKMQGVMFHQIRPPNRILPPRKVEPASQCDCSCTSESACRPGPGSYDNLPISCKEIWDKSGIRVDGSFYIRAHSPSQYAHVFCHMTPIHGCGDGGWTLVMKIDGSKQTFTYDSAYWNNFTAYNEGGGTSLAEVEAKLSSYWSTPFTRICLGMKYNNEENWIAIEHSNSSLREVISKGSPTTTNLTLTEWKRLLNNSQIKENCTIQGFNSDIPKHRDTAKARIGIIGSSTSCGSAADSRIGFGTAGNWYYMDDRNSCGNAVGDGKKENTISKSAFGYIFVQ